jgi:class 3 adenylate cyclase
MAKILVVDDEPDLEPLILQRFRHHIRDGRYQFVFAVNGVHALEQLQYHPDIELVLCDINMPEMDGLTLLSKLHEKHSLLKSVIVSAYGDMDNIRNAMNRGAFDFVTKPINFQDLEITIDKTLLHVRQLRETLQAVRQNNILKMYVDATVLNFMDSREFEASLNATETIDATVAFIDLCRFTELSEIQTPTVVVKLLNAYFDLIVQAIIQSGGYVDKFIGDAVMAVFQGENHLQRAVGSALSAREKLIAVAEDNAPYIPRISVGINAGEMISGNIGSVSLRRLDYTVIGDAVNVAQRLQSIAKANQILITHSSYEVIKEDFTCLPLTETTLKNRSAPVMIYEVV